jgi:hypothetical protein
MVKRIVRACLLLFILAGCTENLTADGLPILKVNDQHMMLDNQAGMPYELPPGPGFALQLAGYKFRIPETLGIDTVNSIQVADSSGQTHILPVKTNVTVYKATGETLAPLGDAAPFPGLVDGETITLGIGYTFPDGRFYPAWMGIITVKGETP